MLAVVLEGGGGLAVALEDVATTVVLEGGVALEGGGGLAVALEDVATTVVLEGGVALEGGGGIAPVAFASDDVVFVSNVALVAFFFFCKSDTSPTATASLNYNVTF